MRFLTPLFVLLLYTGVRAQTFDFPEAETRTYRVSARLIDRIIAGDVTVLTLPGLGAPLPSGTRYSRLPPGHYLQARLVGESVKFTYFSNYAYEVAVNAAAGKFQVRVYDPEGKARPDAVVTADGNPVRYSEKHAAYRRRDWRIDHLRIEVGGDTIFHHITETIKGSRFSHDLQVLRGKEPFRTLRKPFIYVGSVARSLSDGIGHGNWYWPRSYPLKGIIHRLTHPDPVTGYVTTSQPRYRPGDTLRVSAYLAFPRGRPVSTDSVEMTIRSYGGNSKRFTTRIGRSEKGRFTFVKALPTDWPLDQRYNVTFELPGLLRRDVSPNIRFRLEDYELAEYRLSTKVSTNARLPGSAWVDIKADDVNGLALPNGQLTLTVLTESFATSQDSNTVVLPDTLYVHTETTDDRSQRRITLPDSIFPQGHSLRIKVITQLTGPSGEFQESANRMTVDRRFPIIPEIKLRGDSLRIFLLPAGSGLPLADRQATLQTINPTNDTVSIPVVLPIGLPIDHKQSVYRLVYGPQTLRESLGDLSPVAGSPFVWSRDTLLIRFPNPHGQPLRWTLYEEEKMMASGDGSTPLFIRSGFAPGAGLQLQYAYLAAGEWQHQRQDLFAPRYDLLTNHKNVLALTLTQPEKVTPGETVRLTLRATDQQGKPATNVRLTAGTFNAKFNDTPVKMPSYRSKNKQTRKRQGYRRRDLLVSQSATPPYWLVSDFGLDTALAYRLRYPDAEFTHVRDLDTLMPDKRQTAHFAPFVIRKNRLVAIRTVYVDDRLVYWYHPNITTPYSIPVNAGLRHISIRTDRYRYTKQLSFETCRQLVLSFDADRWVTAGWTREERKEWTKEEIDRIHERVFALTNMTSEGVFSFRSSPFGIIGSTENINNADWAPLGLARSNDVLDFWFPGGDSLRLPFEPRAVYRIGRSRDRLYPLDRETIEHFLQKRIYRGPGAPGLPNYFYQPPAKTGRFDPFSQANSLPRVSAADAVARIQFAHLPPDLNRVVLAPSGTDDLFFADRQRPNRVKPGGYDVLYHFRNDSVFHQYVELGEDSLRLLVFRRAAVRHVKNFDGKTSYSKNPSSKAVPEVTYAERVFGNERVSGVLIDQGGEGLIGVSILIEGTNRGTITDLDGRFSLAVPEGTFRLIFSYTGFTKQSLTFTKNSFPDYPLTVTMAEDGAALDEVVVIGYGSVRSRRSAAQTLTADQIRNLPTRNINQIASVAAGVSSSDEGGAINIRGSRSNTTEYYVDGVRVSAPESLAPITTRNNFADYAAFLPHLQTDNDGRAVFDVTFPDDITAWNTFAVGQDRRRRIGFTLEQTTAFLPFQAQLYLPRFLVEGDRSEAATLAINREGDERNVRLSFTDADNGARTQDTVLRTSSEERYPISAPSDVDSLTFRFTVQTLEGKPASDGEERSIPVYPAGTEMVNGELFLLTDNTTALPEAFIRPERGPVVLRLPGNRVQQLLNDLDYIVDYPYACTEQTASRLIGLLQMKAVRSAQDIPFPREADIPKMIVRLEKLRRPDGGFGWWASSRNASSWISLHVYRALTAAEKDGYAVQDLTSIRRYLLGRLPELPVRDQLQILLTLAEEGNPPTEEEITRIDKFFEPSDYELLALTRLRQLRGDTIDVSRLLDSSKTHAALGRYWGRRGYFFYRQPLDGRLACGLLAHRILTDADETRAAGETLNYLLGQTAARNRPGNVPLLGTNTLESARLLAGLLPALLADDDALAAPVVTLRQSGSATQVGSFPYETTVPASAISGLRLERAGSGPLPVSLYQRWFETQPSAKADGFRLTTKLTDARGREVTQLQRGTTVYLEVEVIVAAEADYVLIEVPIPAGCSYANRNEARGRFAVHREYQRDRVAIFCDRLPAGTYTYQVALAPRFGGEYTLNPARAEMQYLPPVNGNTGLETIVID